LKAGAFDADAMIDMLRHAVDQALKEGYRGLWASGDMTWELGTEENLAHLLKYECLLEKLLKQTPGLEGICQYAQNTLPSDIIANALLTHSAVFVNETLYGVNMSYVEPDQLLRNPPPPKTADDVKHMMNQLIAA
jgi:hypothetical protein